MQDTDCDFYRESYLVLLDFFRKVKSNVNLKSYKFVVQEDINLALQTTWDKLGKIEDKYDGA